MDGGRGPGFRRARGFTCGRGDGLGAWARGCCGSGARAGGAGGSRGARLGRGGEGELAGGPEGDHVVQAGDDAGEGGQNQGVQSRYESGLGSEIGGIVAESCQEGGGLAGQG